MPLRTGMEPDFGSPLGGRVTPELRHLQVSLVRRTAPVSRSSLGGSRGTLSRVKCSPSSGTRVAVPNNTFRRSRQRGRGPALSSSQEYESNLPFITAYRRRDFRQAG